jgi:hypothetical protein
LPVLSSSLNSMRFPDVHFVLWTTVFLLLRGWEMT